MHPQREIQSTHGVTLAMHHLGGDGPPLIICHATGFHGRAYTTLAPVLAEHFAVWAVDFRGHGASSEPDSGSYSWSHMGDDLLACVNDLGAESVVAIGHSMGGSSILLAQQKRPGVVSAAYLFEPIVFPPEYLVNRTENPLAGPARRRRPTFPSRQAAYDRYASRPPLSMLHPDALSDYVEYGFVDTDDGEVRLACEPETEARVFDSEEKVTVDRIRGTELRCMIAAGGPAPVGPNPAEFAPQIADAVIGAELAIYEDLTHFGPFQDPQRIANDAIAFLA